MLGDHPDIVSVERTGYTSYNQPQQFYCEECGRDITDEIIYEDESHYFLCKKCLLNLHTKDW